MHKFGDTARIVSSVMTILAVVSAFARATGPVAIPVVNAGFEANVVAQGCFAVFVPTGWPVYDPNGILNCCGNVVGGLNLPVGSIYFPAGAPEGQHAALVFLQDSIGAGPAGLRQVLPATLEANTRYTLTVQVGDIASGVGPPPCDIFGFFNIDGFPGYRVQLLAGGVMIAQDDNTLAGVLDDGEWALSTTQVTIGESHPQLGQALEIRLINLNIAQTPENPGIEVDFDDVQLTAAPACEAAGGDFDGDCDVDLADFADFFACAAGVGVPPLPGCPAGVEADFDDDGDVDMLDYLTFSLNFTGEAP